MNLLKLYEHSLFGLELFFGEFRTYHKLIEGFLSDEHSKLLDSYSEESLMKEAQKAGEFEREYYLHIQDSFIERSMELSTLYPNYFRSSFSIQLIAIAEIELIKICDLVHKQKGTTFRIKDLSGNSNFEKAKLFLKRTINVSLAEDIQDDWVFINKCRVIRNKFVHNGGVIDSNDSKNWEKIIGFQNEQKLFRYKETSDQAISDDLESLTLILGSNYNIKLINSLERFFSKLMEMINEKCG